MRTVRSWGAKAELLGEFERKAEIGAFRFAEAGAESCRGKSVRRAAKRLRATERKIKALLGGAIGRKRRRRNAAGGFLRRVRAERSSSRR